MTLEESLQLLSDVENRLTAIDNEKPDVCPPQLDWMRKQHPVCVLGWDMSWFRQWRRQRTAAQLRREVALVSNRMYRDYYKLLQYLQRHMATVMRTPPCTTQTFPSYNETQPEKRYPTNLLSLMLRQIEAGVAALEAESQTVQEQRPLRGCVAQHVRTGMDAGVSMFRQYVQVAGQEHLEQWQEIVSRLDLLAPTSHKTRSVPADAVPTDAVPTDAVPTDAVPTDAVPTDAVPTDAVPTDAM